MQLREIIKGKVIADDVSVFAMGTAYDDGVKISLGISKSRHSLHVVDLTREAAEKLIKELTAALAVQPRTEAQIQNSRDHAAYVKEREHGYGRN
jgi:hypothetical protein